MIEKGARKILGHGTFGTFMIIIPMSMRSNRWKFSAWHGVMKDSQSR